MLLIYTNINDIRGCLAGCGIDGFFNIKLKVHSLSQRAAAIRLLCEICALTNVLELVS